MKPISSKVILSIMLIFALLATSIVGCEDKDTDAPTITNVTSAKADGSYTTSDVIDITVTFSEAVEVTGTPYLELETGTTDQNATYNSGSGTDTLTFRYTVQNGDAASDLDYKAANSLNLNGGTIRDDAGNDAVLTLASPDAAGSLGANKDLLIYTTDAAPTIPPASTFIMDFDDFNSGGEAASTTVDIETSFQFASFTFEGDDLYSSGEYAAGSQSNWNWAAFNVGVWSFIIVIGMLVPSAAFMESFNHTPQQLVDYTWEWLYDVTAQGDVYSAKLHGKYIDDYNGTEPGVRWEMYLSLEGQYTDFPWYYGESNLLATEGFWILKNNPSNPTDWIEITWARNLAEGTNSITYTNIVPGGPENGGYISFGATTGDPYDRYYHIYNKGADNLAEIEWSSTTKEGRVKDEDHFLDNDWHCWDMNYQNANCSA